MYIYRDLKEASGIRTGCHKGKGGGLIVEIIDIRSFRSVSNGYITR